ncbi:MAG TPA: GNAT family N-acetyltransferase [Blastocatellia bacterium]|nr:GNAT family N-acetyltransferase [Blastocatellia bacterium]
MTEQDPFGCAVRPISPGDEPFLWEMLYHAIYVPEGAPPPPRDILSTPELGRYVRGWGRSGDTGLLAVSAEAAHPIGAVWLRLMPEEEAGYGYVDDETPELSIAMLPGYRGRGAGTLLLTRLLRETEGMYKAISLSVSGDNPALRLYERFGFEVVSDSGMSLIMRRSARRRR